MGNGRGVLGLLPRGQQALSARPRLEAGLALRVAECTRVSMRLYGHSIFVVIFLSTAASLVFNTPSNIYSPLLIEDRFLSTP